jgi:hypothetical protein
LDFFCSFLQQIGSKDDTTVQKFSFIKFELP